jgi:hypothetical protein
MGGFLYFVARSRRELETMTNANPVTADLPLTAGGASYGQTSSTVRVAQRQRVLDMQRIENGLLHSCANPWQTQAVKRLEPPDSIHPEATQGRLELDNQFEANEGLEKITPQLRVHPDVLKLHWQIDAAAKKWELAPDIAKTLTELVPERRFGWFGWLIPAKGAMSLV